MIGIAILIAVMAMSAARYMTAGVQTNAVSVTAQDFATPLHAEGLILIGEKIDINEAGERDLQALHRIGPVLARRIVENRDQGGRFQSVEDLMRVHGIGRKILDRNRMFIEVR